MKEYEVQSVKALRAALDMSQERLAATIGVSWKTIARAEQTGDVSSALVRKLLALAKSSDLRLAIACPCCLRMMD